MAWNDVKMIVTDLDATLLNDNKAISDYTIQILKQCREKNILLVVATARPVREVNALFRDLLPDMYVYHSGAVVRARNDQLEAFRIPYPVVKEILLRITALYPACEIALEVAEQLYANYDVGMHWSGAEYTRSGLHELVFDAAEKILIRIGADVDPKRILQCIPAGYYFEVIVDGIGMILNEEATKLRGIERICSYESINLNKVIAFGDDNTDITLLQSCGLGVAVRNANQAVKDAADMVCGSNNEDGVARWILEHVLLSSRL